MEHFWIETFCNLVSYLYVGELFLLNQKGQLQFHWWKFPKMNKCVFCKWILHVWLLSSGAVSAKNEQISVCLVFSFKVQVWLDSQSSETERLKEIHKMPSALRVTRRSKFSLLWLVWLCEMTFSFLILSFFPTVILLHVSLFVRLLLYCPLNFDDY